VISILFTLTAKLESTITAVSSVAIFASYFLVILAGFKVMNLPPLPGTFSLGKFARPLAYVGMAWCVLIAAALTVPSVGHAAAKGAVVMLALGIIWYFVRVKRVAATQAELHKDQGKTGSLTP
jgi:amino acid transporter